MANEIERFQDFCRKYINRKVKEYFKDLGDERWQPDLNLDRHFVRWVCTHQDNDPLALTVGRLLVYFFKVQGLLDEPLYFIPTSRLQQQNVQTIPQVIINFQETAQSAQANKRTDHPLGAHHHIRFEKDFSSEAEVQALARKVREAFATPLFHFDKGRLKYTYLDKIKGFLFIVATPNETEARKVIEKLLFVVGESPNWDLLTESRSNKNFSQVKTIRINGKSYKQPQMRPTGKVYFLSAELHVEGLPGNIRLLDLSGRSSNTVLSA
jgi:hypothetical protein